MEKMRLLQVLEATVGGTRRHLISLVSRIDRHSFEVEVAGPTVRHGALGDTQFREQINQLGIPFHPIEMQREIRLGPDLKALLQLSNLIRRGRFDLVHTHSSKAGFLGRFAARLNGVPTVYTPNGFYFLSARSAGQREIFLRLEQLAGQLTDRIIAVSTSERQAVIENHIVKDSKVVMIPNGIDLTAHQVDSAARARIRAELNIPSESLVVGTVSRHIAQKDPPTLIRAFQRILTAMPETRLLWCGEGELQPETEKLAHDLQLSHAVQFLGFRPDVLDIMNAFDVFVLSSLFEGLPYSVLEAMARELPIVATNVIGNRDVVIDGTTGLLVPPSDPQLLAEAVVQLLSNPTRRQQLGRNGRVLVGRSYCIGQMVKDTEEVYRSLRLSTTHVPQ
jgi:glycosyltransferase involved in cell wall biosynthesis